jgi:hypothetical protein
MRIASAREELFSALWRQTDELLLRTRRQIEALSALETNDRAADRCRPDYRREGSEDDGAMPWR